MDNKIDIILNILDKINAKDVMIYDTKDSTPFFEKMVVATAVSSRQLNAFSNHLKEEAEKNGFDIKGVEGAGSNEWVLADLGDIIVNIFTKEARENYDLDRLWKRLPKGNKNEN